jgi:hypothetical protein
VVANFHDQTVAPSALIVAPRLHVVPIETTLKQNTNKYSNLKHATETMREYLIFHGEGWQAFLVDSKQPYLPGYQERGGAPCQPGNYNAEHTGNGEIQPRRGSGITRLSSIGVRGMPESINYRHGLNLLLI